jgi:hypothetical protein
VLIDGAQIDAVLIVERRAADRAAVEQRAVEIRRSIGVLGEALDELRADEAAIRRAMQIGVLRLSDALREEAPRILGVLSRHGDAVAFAPVARGDPAVAALHGEGIFGKIALAAVRRRRVERRTAMGEHHEVAVPILRHRREDESPAVMLDAVAGDDARDLLGAGGARRQILRERRTAHHRACQPKKAIERRSSSDVLHGHPLFASCSAHF